MIVPLAPHIAERINAKVRTQPNFGCWIWLGAKNNKGYAQIRIQRKCYLVHRVLFESIVGPIPAGLELDHLCRQPACVNPIHMEAVTHAVNIRRGRRAPWKEACPGGHAYTSANTYWNTRGHRVCLTCKRARGRLTQQRAKAAR